MISTVAQLVGLLVALVGLFLLAGLAWALLAGGVAVVVFGVALELGSVTARRGRGTPGGDA